jgi:hypothetical protein
VTYPWKTFSVPLVVNEEDARTILREAELQRDRDRRSIRETLAYMGAIMAGKKCSKGGGKKKGGY